MRREASDDAQPAKRRWFAPAVDGERDPAIKHARMLGAWSARTILLIEIVYIAVFVAGFAPIGSTSGPITSD